MSPSSMTAAALLTGQLVWAPPALPREPAPTSQPSIEPAIDDVAVEWTAPSECPTREILVARLAELAPKLSIASDDGPARVHAEVRLAADATGRWSVALTLTSPDGAEQRAFVAESCAVAAEAVALVLAISIDPVAVATRIDSLEHAAASPGSGAGEVGEVSEAGEAKHVGDADAPAEPTPDPPAAPARGSIRDDAWVERSPVRTRVGLAIVGGGGYGPLRSGVGVLGAQLAVFGPRWRWELRGTWLPPVPRRVEGTRTLIDGGIGSSRGCWVPRMRVVELPLCGGFDLGAIRARPLSPNSQLYLGFLVGFGLRWAPTQRVAIGLDLEGLFGAVTGGFTRNGQVVLDTLPVGVRALAGVELRLR